MASRKKTRNTLLSAAVFIVIAAVVLFPLVWIIPAAFKPTQELWSIPNTFLPKNPTLENFKKIFTMRLNNFNFLRSLGYTLLVSVASTVLHIIVNSLAAFAFARLEFRGKKLLWPMFMSMMFVPGIATLVASVQLVSTLKMVDTLWVLIIPGTVSAYCIFFFRQFFLSIPGSTDEAAYIDGCSPFRVYLSIFMPIALTPIIIMGTRSFMGNWNSFVWPTLTIVRNSRISQVMQVVRLLHSNYSYDYGAVIAATIMATVVPLVMFAVVQKRIIGGIAISGLK